MNPAIENLRRRKIQVYEIQAGPQLVKITVETPKHGETRVGVTVPLNRQAPALDSAEVDVVLLGPGHFNAVAFPRSGALPELRIGRRAAIGAFKFEAATPGSRARGLELSLRGRRYQVQFHKNSSRTKANHIPSSVAKLLPKAWAAAKSK